MSDEIKFDPDRFKRFLKVRPVVRETEGEAKQRGLTPDKTSRSTALSTAEKQQKNIDESERKREEAEKDKQVAQEEGRTDHKTGLLNERGFTEALRREVERAMRLGQTLGLLALDLDNFKMVNDRYGHPMGDKVLKAIASIINEHIPGKDSATRAVDIPVRPEGADEIYIILPDIKDQLEFAGERIRIAIETKIKEIVPEIKDIPLSVSIGGTTYIPPKEIKKEQHFEEIEGIILKLRSESDIALYQSKYGGKNKLTIYQPGMIMPQEPQT